jgi:hypothetical protein
LRRLLRTLARETASSGWDCAEPLNRDVAPAGLAAAESSRAKALERGVDLVESRLIAIVELPENPLDLRPGGVLDGRAHLALSEGTELLFRDPGCPQKLDPGRMEHSPEFLDEQRG